ncbi:hypothetical protein ACOMHN_035748 [Nucella lapillus]
MAALPRPPHRGTHINDRPPPSLPPRSGARAMLPPPATTPPIDSDSDPDDYLEPDSKGNAPEEIYDDCNENDNLPDAPDEVYDDCGDQPPPLPPLPEPGDYDDFEEQPKPPVRPPAKLPSLETYDDLDNIGPVVVQQIPRVRPIPRTPVPPPPAQGIVEDVYEDPDASQPTVPQRGPSPPVNLPPVRSWAKVPEPSRAISPGRSKSPSRFSERSLPPLPPSLDSRQGQQLPPIPPGGASPARGSSPTPVPATRNRHQTPDCDRSGSPVVVPLRQHHKGELPPLPVPPYSDYDDAGGAVQDGRDFEQEDQCFEDSEPPPPSNDQSDNTYEVKFDEPRNNAGFSPPPPPPPPPPKEQCQPPPIRRPSLPRGAPPPPAQTGLGNFSINLGQLKDLRAGLRKVSVGSGGGGSGSQQDSNSGTGGNPKVYGECAPSVSNAKRMFQEKSIGKPGVTAQKPAIFPKFGNWKASGNSSSNNNAVVKPLPRSISPRPPVPPVKETSASQAPDVTFLPKANKVSLSALSLPSFLKLSWQRQAFFSFLA